MKKYFGFSIESSPKLHDSYIFLYRCKIPFHIFTSSRPTKNRIQVQLHCPSEEDFKEDLVRM